MAKLQLLVLLAFVTAGFCVPAFSCPDDLTDCGGVCVNTVTDINNCGSCGHACPPSSRYEDWFCAGGECFVAYG
ncbi:hypothetical protein QBC39DRAFT_349214 [Podospora conica]|nr:hypothetical protein QBC39DRAFT_349214 [Schizothecium conicum]